MNRKARRAEQARQRHRDKRAAVGRQWAALVVDQLVQASEGHEATAEAGWRDGPKVCNVQPVAVPPAFIEQLILLRPLIVDGIQIAHTRTGPTADEGAWYFEYESLAFLVRGPFTGCDPAEYRAALAQIKFPAVIAKVPPAPRYRMMRRFHVEELASERVPLSFLVPYHPDAAVDAELKKAEAATVQAFWAMRADD